MKRRFALVALAVGILVTLAWGVPLAAVTYNAARSQSLLQAEKDAEALAAVMRVTGDPQHLRSLLATVPALRRDQLTVYLSDGSTLGSPPRGPASAYTKVRTDKNPVIVDTSEGIAYLTPAGNAIIEAHVPRAVLLRQLRSAWGPTALLGIFLVLSAGFAATGVARGAVRACKDLATAAHQLGDGDTLVRVVPGGPADIATAGKAFNDMAERIRTLVANERELLADVSHRLRTPLTALRLNAEALPPGEGRQRVLAAAIQAEEELGAIIRQARQPRQETRSARCDIAEVASDRTAYWAILAFDQHRVCTDSGLGVYAPVATSRADAASAVDNVLSNVFLHTPPGTDYQVSILRHGAFIQLIVDDAGPGIDTPEQALARGSSGVGSTGLGLDIARRVVESAGGSLSVGSSPMGGARISLSFRELSSPDDHMAGA